MNLTDDDKRWINERLETVIESLIEHIHSVGGSMHTQLQETETRIMRRFDPLEARLDEVIACQQPEIDDLRRRFDNR